MPTSKPVLSSREVKLLYTLLDAAHEEGRLPAGPLLEQWVKIKEAAAALQSLERAELYRLTEKVEATGALNATWMPERWLAVKERVEKDPVERPPSQAPFPPR